MIIARERGIKHARTRIEFAHGPWNGCPDINAHHQERYSSALVLIVLP